MQTRTLTQTDTHAYCIYSSRPSFPIPSDFFVELIHTNNIPSVSKSNARPSNYFKKKLGLIFDLLLLLFCCSSCSTSGSCTIGVFWQLSFPRRVGHCWFPCFQCFQIIWNHKSNLQRLRVVQTRVAIGCVPCNLVILETYIYTYIYVCVDVSTMARLSAGTEVELAPNSTQCWEGHPLPSSHCPPWSCYQIPMGRVFHTKSPFTETYRCGKSSVCNSSGPPVHSVTLSPVSSKWVPPSLDSQRWCTSKVSCSSRATLSNLRVL